MKINVVQNVLRANDIVAQKNREVFKEKGVLAVNFISSPGSGKTTLLEKTLEALLPDQKTAVIVGDLETTRDARRLSVHAGEVTQINTGTSCHLYANQISESLEVLTLREMDYLFIENVGNLVCPGEFDLGENLKVALLSIPEGDDKVAKYPTIFRVADIILLTKFDLYYPEDFNLERVKQDLSKLNVNAPLIPLSSKKGWGMEAWLKWLISKQKISIGAQAKYVEVG